MERVTVRTYLETLDVKRYGAHYERPNGERIEITSGELGPELAKDKAAGRLYKCEWEKFRASRQDGFFEVGHGWIDEPDKNFCEVRRRLARAVETASQEVLAAQQEGISGKVAASVPSFLNARNAELKAVSDLDKHRKEHGC
jgi:hypothetical protein